MDALASTIEVQAKGYERSIQCTTCQGMIDGPDIQTPLDCVYYEERLEALHAAIEKNHLSDVNRELAVTGLDALVLDECYSPHAIRSCRTPLRHAAFCGHYNIVTALLEHPNTSAMAYYSEDSWSALHSAASRGHDEVLIAFLTKSSDIHSSARFDGFGVLHIVAEVCNRKLANDGADVMAHALKYYRGLIHERSTRGRFMQEWTPLHVCCLKGKVSAAQLLLKAGAKPSMRTGPVCIHSAILNDIASGRVRVGKIDPDRDADDGALPRNRGFPLLHLDMVDEGLLPIHLAALGGHFKTAMLLLKQYGGDPSSASLKHQWTVLHFAVWGGNLNLVQELCRLTNRKYVNGRDRRSDGSEWTPLSIAVARQNTHLVQCLLSFGADPTESIRSADFPGCHFVRSNPSIHDDTECGCKWSSEDGGITLLHLAVVAADVPMLRLLVPVMTHRHYVKQRAYVGGKGRTEETTTDRFENSSTGGGRLLDGNTRLDPLGFGTDQGWTCAVLAVLLHTVDPEMRLRSRFVHTTITQRETSNRKEVIDYLFGEAAARGGRSCFGEDSGSPPSVPQRLDSVCQALCIKVLEYFASTCSRLCLESTLSRCTHVTLLRACHSNRHAVVEYLLQNKLAHPACPFIKPISSRPVHVCASLGYGELLQLVVDAGGDPSEVDEHGRKPIWKLNDFHRKNSEFLLKQLARMVKVGEPSSGVVEEAPNQTICNGIWTDASLRKSGEVMPFSPVARE